MDTVNESWEVNGGIVYSTTRERTVPVKYYTDGTPSIYLDVEKEKSPLDFSLSKWVYNTVVVLILDRLLCRLALNKLKETGST